MVRERISMREVSPTQTPDRQPSAEKLEEAAKPTISDTATPAHSGITFAAYSNLQSGRENLSWGRLPGNTSPKSSLPLHECDASGCRYAKRSPMLCLRPESPRRADWEC